MTHRTSPALATALASILAATLASVPTTTAFAQATAVDFSQFRFGLNLSPSISWIGTDDSRISGDGTAFGIKIATQAEYFFAPNYAIESGIGFHFNTGGTLLSQYPGRFFDESLPTTSPFNSSSNTPAGNVRLDYSINYLEIPLGLRLHTREFGFVRYYVQAPMFTLGIRTGATANISGGNVPIEEEEIDITKDVSPLAISWGFGAGAEYEVGGGTVLVGGIQFQRIFTDVTKDGGEEVYLGRMREEDPKAQVNSITVRLGVLF